MRPKTSFWNNEEIGVLRVMFDKNTRVTVGKVVVVSLDGFAPRLARLKHNILSMGWSQGTF